MKRIMGIDYGDARTGIAISDLLCSTTQPDLICESLAEITELLKGE